MVNETIKQRITAELRELRKAPGCLDDVKLTGALAVTKGLGGDDPEIALGRLVGIAAEQTSDREIQAAMASFGWGVQSEASLDRLAEFSERHFVDPRTVRRWSDAGILKLTQLIVGKSPWIQPRAVQRLSESTSEIFFSLELLLPSNVWMNKPTLSVNDQLVELDIPSLEQGEREQRFRSSTVPLGSFGDLPIEINIRWGGERYAAFDAITQGNARLTVRSRLVLHSLRTTLKEWKAAH